MDRRGFIQALATALGSGALASGGMTPRAAVADARRPPMRILVLGGTRFIGIHLTRLAGERGHTVTLFNRGRTRTGLFPRLEHLKGDRNGELDALRGRSWDAVIDDSGYVPRHVRLSAELLAPHVQQYLFVSTVSVYASTARPNEESSATARIADETVEKVDGETYGPLKALCERAAESAMPGRVTVLRPGLIVGPQDNTDRFTYWPARAARGGEFLAPGTPADGIQFIDARDLAKFALHALENGTKGTFNVVSAPGKITMGDLVSQSILAANALVRPVPPPHANWAPADFLEAQKVQPWSDMPVWLPGTGDSAGFAQTLATRAQGAGLTIRPLRDTVRDTLAWHLTRPRSEQSALKAGIAPEREREVLAAWRGGPPSRHADS